MKCDFGYIRKQSPITGEKGLTLFDKDKKWIIKLTSKGVRFNLRGYKKNPNSFAREVVSALEKKFSVFIIEKAG